MISDNPLTDSMLNRALEKKLFAISDFIVVFEQPTHANTLGIFGFRRGSPRWTQRASKKSRFFENCWRCPSLEDHILGSTWPIWMRVCLLERSDSLLSGKNMKFGIYRLSPILGHHRCLVDYNSRGTFYPGAALVGM